MMIHKPRRERDLDDLAENAGKLNQSTPMPGSRLAERKNRAEKSSERSIR